LNTEFAIARLLL